MSRAHVLQWPWMTKRKLRHYRDVIPQLAAAGISFRPMIWTAKGRPHPAAARTLRYADRLAATRGGGAEEVQGFVLRWRVAIQRRRAAMARSVLPLASASEIWLLSGRTEEPLSTEGRAPQISAADLEEEPDEGI